jgi:tetratricopeptide (TPR) repeat protein
MAAVVLFAAGCAPKDPLPPGKHYPSSHINVPFVFPRSELCGSTAIEMVSSYWQSTTSYVPNLSVEELDGRTLIPAKGGTLQIELVATARANGLIAYTLEPTFDALFSELSEHHPVIVLVNRSYSWYPLWHYAPVIGFDEGKRNVLLHFSDQPNEAMSLSTFAALWKRSHNWGVVLLPPGELPVSVSSKKFLRAAYEFEKVGDVKGAVIAYKSALVRWPEDTDILFALANAYYNGSNLSDAEESYRKLLSLNPSHPLVINNLAMLLCRTGRGDEGSKLLKKAVSDNPKILSLLKSTEDEINAGCFKSSK